MVETLREWFLKKKRSLPWRENATPYAVWVSEIMLQQTQVSVVLPYFERWMERFPTPQALATAPLEEVIKLWEGLGYYRRARNLHAGAKQILTEFGGELPQTAKELETIKGIGPYTIGAILSFAFKQKAAAVDGNVRRVVSRLYNTTEKVDPLVEKMLPNHRPFEVMEGLIEFGALVCKKKPDCQSCPLKEKCQAYKAGTELELPPRTKLAKTSHLHRVVIILRWDGHLLLKQGKVGKVMEGLYEFPYFDKEVGEVEHHLKMLGLKGVNMQPLSKTSHTFTRYKAHLYPYLIDIQKPVDLPGCAWYSEAECAKIPFSSGHKRILSEYTTY